PTGRPRRPLRIAYLQRQRDREARADAWATVDAHHATERGGELLDDVEAQADAAAARRPAVRTLMEHLEDALQAVGVNALAGIDDLEVDPRAHPVGAGADRHRALLGILERVVDQIAQNHFQLAAIAAHSGGAVVRLPDERDAGLAPIDRQPGAQLVE